MSCYSNSKDCSAARKRRAKRLLRKAQVLGNSKLANKAKSLSVEAEKDYFAKSAA